MGYDKTSLAALSLVIFVNAYGVTFIFSFIGFMIVDLGEAKTRNEAGYVAGYVTSAYFLGRMLSSALWGYVADKYGRKPVLLISMLSVGFGGVLFGASTTFNMALTVRFLSGFFNGASAVTKAMAHELTSGEHKAAAMSLVTGTWSLGLILAPAISGWTASIPSNTPNTTAEATGSSLRKVVPEITLLSKSEYFEQNPYMLPSIIASAFGMLGFVLACFFLPETLHQTDLQGGYRAIDSENEGRERETIASDEVSSESNLQEEEKESLCNKDFIMCVSTYAVLGFAQMFIDDVIPLWSLASKDVGGLNFGSQDSGTLLAMCGILMLLASIFLYPVVARYLSPSSTMIVCSLMSGILVILQPIIVRDAETFSGVLIQENTIWVWTALILMNGTRQCAIMMAFNANFLLTNNSVTKSVRGRGNGISMGASSFARIFAPAAGAYAFAWSVEEKDGTPVRHWPFNYHFVFNIDGLFFCLVAALVFFCMPKRANSPNQNSP